MPGSVDRRRARTRQGLLDAAERLFAERGYRATTVNALAQAADVAVSSLYFNFPGGKSDVYVALAERAVAINEQMLKAAHATAGAPLDRLQAVGDAYTRFHLEHPLALRLIALHDLDPAGDPRLSVVRAGIDARLAVMLEQLAALIDEAQVATDRDARADPREAATFLWGAWNGNLALHARGLLDEARLRAVLRTGQQLTLAALR